MISVDNQRRVLMHGYVVKHWCQIPILLIMERVVDIGISISLTKGNQLKEWSNEKLLRT
jgi:hypothetical protein